MGNVRQLPPSVRIVAGLAGAAVPLAALPAVGTAASATLDVLAVALAALLTVLALPSIPAPARPAWRMLAASLLISLVAEVLFRWFQFLDSTRWPTPADILYCVSYVPLMLGLLRLDRQRGRRLRLGGLLDTLIVTVSTAAMATVFLILPMISAGLVNRAGQLVSTVYVLYDVVIVFLALRLLGAGTTAVRLLVTGLLCLFAGDVAEQVMAARTSSIMFPRWINLLWLLFYLGIALAAVSAARTRPARTPARTPDLPALEGMQVSLRRLLAMTVAAGLPTVIFLLPGERTAVEGMALGTAATILLGLVLTRFWDLHRRLDRQTRALAAMAATDPLTGVANRRTWDAELARLLSSPTGSGTGSGTGGNVLIAVLDLDHFKRYNDTHGHGAGDDLLRETACAWAGEIGARGVLARWGGEEFLVALTCRDLDEGQRVLERLRPLVPDGQTVSIGVALWDGAEGAASVLRRADGALYEAKQRGRDRMVVAGLVAA
ncbi:GGDEF domain-containing protein [Kineosporia sp. J2-2]|uniref:GGDEF domain-containing protein n=1 Tax=Kineosporia corallincola TaxID=2835133 RepID=A0ABS5TBV6_9ACTN|nr:GGDEF domain-containing protein [Kineosporia corallincola]MBT0768323.1 GGDEF domain-containing protein [Kineosporia corallincola]